MSYDPEVIQSAKDILEQRRLQAVDAAEKLRERVVAKQPRAKEIEQEMTSTSMQIAQAVVEGEDVDATVERIKQTNLQLQKELTQEIQKAGENAKDFQPIYFCNKCNDSGFSDGRICSCYQSLLRDQACKSISYTGMGQLTFDKAGNSGFESLRLDYYPDKIDSTGVSPKRRMRDIFTFCQNYAEDFGKHSPSLLLTGRTGTGKTHVSLAIAHIAASKGHRVIYGPAQMLLHKLEKEHFGREGGNSLGLMTGCDLLVLDDLGAEFSSPFYNSCLYNLINVRMLEGLPTIISTNLDQSQINDRYGEQITSRIIGTYLPLQFMGNDIRQIKLKQRM